MEINKYTVRRFIFAVLSAPVVVGAYWLVWAFIIVLGATGGHASFERNAWTLAVFYVVAVTLYPQIRRVVARVTGETND
jgi:hypothetical protein